MTELDPPLVHVVDDDAALRDSLRWLLESAGLRVATYASAESFLEAYAAAQGGCLLLDIRMPGMSGLELQDELKRRGYTIPIVFITGHGDVPMAVNAVKKGALEFIEKPYNAQALLVMVDHALDIDAEARRVAARLGRLTKREREVMELVIAGKRNQDIAAELSISIKTVEAHRAGMMWKMGVDSLAELVQLVG
ncbi:MAG: DNA-binding response regulator [Betaproteobacteria bacterium RIFCSPLOWO2_12_FULL_66_14]|nr:MAG: DNA-binding response regulator [Betaproteobacteria bacterium RIFCSPLOWO2_12_FULL_66_14]